MTSYINWAHLKTSLWTLISYEIKLTSELQLIPQWARWDPFLIWPWLVGKWGHWWWSTTQDENVLKVCCKLATKPELWPESNQSKLITQAACGGFYWQTNWMNIRPVGIWNLFCSRATSADQYMTIYLIFQANQETTEILTLCLNAALCLI